MKTSEDLPTINELHSQFITAFFDKNAIPFHQLIAPVGYGRSQITLNIIHRLTDETNAKYILVLTPGSLVSFFADLLRTKVKTIPVVAVDDRTLRRLVASVPVGENPWPSPVVVVMSIDYAKTGQASGNLSLTTWDLIVVDEAHRLVGKRKELIARLVNENKVKRLLLFPISPLDPSTLNLNEIETTVWKPRIFYILMEQKNKIIEYSYGVEELKLINLLKELLYNLPDSHFNIFFAEVMLKQAYSSLYTLEQSLFRMLNSSVNLDEIGEASISALIEENIEAIDEEITTGNTLSFAKNEITELLDMFDLIGDDTKYHALNKLIGQLLIEKEKPHIVLVSRYSTTVSYLSSRLTTSQLKVYQITSTSKYSTVEQALNDFQSTGGILIISAISKLMGLDIEKATDVILYDLSGNTRSILQYINMILSRFGNEPIPSIYVLKETSKVLPYDQILIDALNTIGHASV